MRQTSMLVLLLGLASSCATIPAESAKPFNDYADWFLEEPLTYRILDTDYSITVPAGFVTDYASIPRSACLFLPTHGAHSRAAIVHDYLYWTGACSQSRADKIMYLAMVEQGVKVSTRRTIYNTLERFGKAAFKKNQELRKGGTPRVIPDPMLAKIGSGEISIADKTWAEFRKEVSAFIATEEYPAVEMDAAFAAENINVDWAAIDELYTERSKEDDPAWWQVWRWLKFWEWF